MHSWHRAIISMLAVVGMLAALPAVVYVAGLARVDGRPTPADPAQFSREAVAAAWAQCRETSPVSVKATNPWGVIGKFMFGNPLRTSPGERAAWRIASAHNVAHPVGNATWWHTSGAAYYLDHPALVGGADWRNPCAGWPVQVTPNNSFKPKPLRGSA